MKTCVHAALLVAIAATGGCSWLSLFVDVETACTSDAACPADRPFCVADVCREVGGVGEGEGEFVGEGEGEFVGEGEGEVVGEGEFVGEGEGEVVVGEGEGEGLCDVVVETFATEPLRLIVDGDAEFVRQVVNDTLVISVPAVEGGLFFTPAPLFNTPPPHMRWEMELSEGLPMVFGQQAYVGFIDETGSAGVLMIVLEGTLVARIDVGGTFDDVALPLDPQQKGVALGIEIEETAGGLDVTWRAGLPGQLRVVRNAVFTASGGSFLVPAVVVQNFTALELPAKELVIDEVRLSTDCPP